MACYRQAAERLGKAAAACPEENPDRAIISCHADEILVRVAYLESLGGDPATTPLEEHIGIVTLRDHRESPQEAMFHGEGSSGGHQPATPSWRKQATSAAAISGTAGLLV